MCKLGFLGVIGFLRDVVIVVVDFGNGSDLEVWRFGKREEYVKIGIYMFWYLRWFFYCFVFECLYLLNCYVLKLFNN